MQSWPTTDKDVEPLWHLLSVCSWLALLPWNSLTERPALPGLNTVRQGQKERNKLSANFQGIHFTFEFLTGSPGWVFAALIPSLGGFTCNMRLRLLKANSIVLKLQKARWSQAETGCSAPRFVRFFFYRFLFFLRESWNHSTILDTKAGSFKSLCYAEIIKRFQGVRQTCRHLKYHSSTKLMHNWQGQFVQEIAN